MSLYSYWQSQNLSSSDPDFAALIMAAIRKADTENNARLQSAFPEIYQEFTERYHAPGGRLESEQIEGE